MISESVLIELIREVSRNTKRIDDLPRPEVGSGGNGPADAEYLVNAASDGLTNEIVVTAASGYIIRGHDPGAGVTWEDYDASTEGAVLIGDGTDIISDTTPTFVDVVSFDANTRVLDGNELQFYDVGDSNYVGFEAPALTANQIWVLPNADGGANEFLQTDGAGNLQWAGGAGGTDLTGLGTDDRIARWNGTDTIQNSLVQIDDSGNIEFINDDLYIGRGGDVRIKFDSSNGYIDAILDDAEGSDRWRIIDSGAVEVAYIDSDGNAQFDGNVTAANFYGADGTEFGISGAELITIDGANGFIELTGINALTLQDGDYIGIEANERLQFNAAGTIEVLGADLDLSTNDLILDADGDTYIHASADDTIEYVINGAGDFSMTANSLNILSGSDIDMADGTSITGGAGEPTIEFDLTNDYLEIMNASVGINIAVPAQDFHVVGNTRFQQSAANTGGFAQWANDTGGVQAFVGLAESFGGTGENLGLRAESEIRFLTGGANEYVVIDGSGQMGLNEMTPSARLHANSGGDNVVAIFESTDATSAISLIDSTGTCRIVNDSSKLRYDTDATTGAMYILNGGKVVIGASSASGQLHVDQSSATGAEPVLLLDQGDADQAFVDFVGSSGAGTSFSINTTERSTFQAMLQIEINGTTYWLKAYQ